MMKRFLRFLTCIVTVAAALWLGSPRRLAIAAPVTSNGITVDLWSLTPGSTVSNTITLTADASSLAGPITKVEFYADGVLIGTVTNKMATPGHLTTY